MQCFILGFISASLKKILKKVKDSPDEESKKKNLVDLQELVTNAQWATDEGDFGNIIQMNYYFL